MKKKLKTFFKGFKHVINIIFTPFEMLRIGIGDAILFLQDSPAAEIAAIICAVPELYLTLTTNSGWVNVILGVCFVFFGVYIIIKSIIPLILLILFQFLAAFEFVFIATTPNGNEETDKQEKLDKTPESEIGLRYFIEKDQDVPICSAKFLN